MLLVPGWQYELTSDLLSTSQRPLSVKRLPLFLHLFCLGLFLHLFFPLPFPFSRTCISLCVFLFRSDSHWGLANMGWDWVWLLSTAGEILLTPAQTVAIPYSCKERRWYYSPPIPLWSRWDPQPSGIELDKLAHAYVEFMLAWIELLWPLVKTSIRRDSFHPWTLSICPSSSLP